MGADQKMALVMLVSFILKTSNPELNVSDDPGVSRMRE